MLWEYAIDAGSDGLRLVKRGDAAILREPCYAAVRTGRDTPFAWGERAFKIYNRAPEGVKVIKIVSGGCPAHPALFAGWARAVVDEDQEILKRNTVLMACPSMMRHEEKEETQKRLIDEGFAAVGTVKSILASALGAGENILEPECVCLADIGAEKIALAVISGGRIVKEAFVPKGASVVTERLRDVVREKMAAALSEESARELLFEGRKEDAGEFIEKPVFDFVTGFPAVKKIPVSYITDAVSELSGMVSDALEKLISFLPEELSGDITRKGITLTGGGAAFKDVENAIREKLALPVRTAETPEKCTAKGLIRILNSQKTYQALIEDEMEAVRRP